MCKSIVVMTNVGYRYCDTVAELFGELGVVKVLPEHVGRPMPPDACLCAVDEVATARHHGMAVVPDDEFEALVMVRLQ